MKTWAQKEGYFHEGDVALLEMAKKIFVELPEIEGDQPVSCHQLAEAFALRFSMQRVTGHFAKVYQHSWLVTQDGNILDIYPVGIEGGPILVEAKTSIMSPGRKLYVASEGNIPLEREFRKPEFEQNVATLLAAMKQIVPP